MDENKRGAIFRTCLVILRLIYSICTFSLLNIQGFHPDKESVVIMIFTASECAISCIFIMARFYMPAGVSGAIGVVFFSTYTTIHAIKLEENQYVMCAVYSVYTTLNLVPGVILTIVYAPSPEEDEEDDDLELVVARSARIMPSEREATLNEVCCICIDKVEKGEMIFDIKCKHEMHRICLEKWLKSKPNTRCPLCLSSIEQ
jgi:Ring finger domain